MLSASVILLLTSLALAGCAKHGNNLLVVNEGQDFAWADKGYVYNLKEKGICMTETYHKAVEDLKVEPL
jgi:hypothetical protein